jgi:hypothetical protein
VSSDQLDLGAGAAARGRRSSVGLAIIWKFDLQGGTASTMIGHMRLLSQIVVPTVVPVR